MVAEIHAALAELRAGNGGSRAHGRQRDVGVVTLDHEDMQFIPEPHHVVHVDRHIDLGTLPWLEATLAAISLISRVPALDERLELGGNERGIVQEELLCRVHQHGSPAKVYRRGGEVLFGLEPELEPRAH